MANSKILEHSGPSRDTPEINFHGRNQKNEEMHEFFKATVCRYSWMDYEKRLLGRDMSTTLERKMELAVKFIESRFTTKYGIQAKVSKHNDMSSSYAAIPNIFDTCVIIDTMITSGIRLSPEIVQSTKELILRNRNEDGLWNYFLKPYKILPNDVDDSSNAALALYASGMPMAEIREIAQVILENAVFHEDNLIDVYFRKSPELNEGHSGGSGKDSSAFELFPEVRRIDLAITANVLYLQSLAGKPYLDKLLPSYELLDRAIDAMRNTDCQRPVALSYAYHNDNIDVIFIFISRLVPVSKYCQSLFKEKLGAVLEFRLRLETYGPISLACRILAAGNVELLEMEENKTLLWKALEKLLQMQDPTDYGFRIDPFYNAHRTLYFGSRALSTALAVSAMNSLKQMYSIESNNNMSF